MQKKSRFLTGLLSAIMALTLFALPATAEGAEEANTANPVWTQTTGSITIHKYEYNETGGSNGTGEDTDVAPEGATALPNAKFAVYKVKNRDWLEGYYGGKVGDYSEAELKW